MSDPTSAQGALRPEAPSPAFGPVAPPAREDGIPTSAGPTTPPPSDPAAPPPALVRSPLSDGEWHRLHPLTPLLRGGLFLLVVIGIVIANLRDRLVFLFLPWLGSDSDTDEAIREWEGSGDPIDFVIANNLYLVAALAVLAVLLVVVAAFYMSWRFHTFRITGRRRRGAQRHPVPHAPPSSAGPRAGRQPDPPDGRAPARHGQARGRGGRRRRERQARVPLHRQRRGGALRHPASCFGASTGGCRGRAR